MPHASCPAHLPASRHTKEAIEDRPRWPSATRIARGAPVGCGQDLLRRPKKTKKSPAPAFHAASKAIRLELRDAYAWFVAAYRAAAEKLRAGVRDVVFPRGSFPPALPFVSG